MPSTSLLADIKSDNDDVRTAAWLRASDVGIAAVGPLAVLVAEQPMEISRAAKRGIGRSFAKAGVPERTPNVRQSRRRWSISSMIRNLSNFVATFCGCYRRSGETTALSPSRR